MTRIVPPAARHSPPTAGATGSPAASDPRAKLRATAQQLEGVFTEQLFKAMRETVPQGEGAFDGGAGEEMFTGLMDQRLAADTPKRWNHGIGDALYRQLSRALPGGAAGGTDGTSSTSSTNSTSSAGLTAPGTTPATPVASDAAPAAAAHSEDPR